MKLKQYKGFSAKGQYDASLIDIEIPYYNGRNYQYCHVGLWEHTDMHVNRSHIKRRHVYYL